jgi:hypothetical protein
MGLVGRAALRENQELSEFAFVPDEFLLWLPETTQAKIDEGSLRQLPAWSGAKVTALPPQSDQVLDDICTLFAALRMELVGQLPRLSTKEADYWQLLLTLTKSLDLLDQNDQPNENARVFLEKPRGEALRWLAQSWAQSQDIDELRLMPQLRCEGNWQHSATSPRRIILDRLSALTTGTWFKTQDLVDDIYQHHRTFCAAVQTTTPGSSAAPTPKPVCCMVLNTGRTWKARISVFSSRKCSLIWACCKNGQLTDHLKSQVFQITPRFFRIAQPGGKARADRRKPASNGWQGWQA